LGKSPEDFPMSRILLIYRDKGEARACELSEIGDRIAFRGSTYEIEKRTFSNYDCLRDAQDGALIGFKFFPFAQDEVLNSPLVRNSSNILHASAMLILLAVRGNWTSDHAEFPGTVLYRHPTSHDYFLAIPEQAGNWRNLGFPLEDRDVPSVLKKRAA
jgi:hypothetical protein